MISSDELAQVALDEKAFIVWNQSIQEHKTMKTKKTFYNHTTGEDYDPRLAVKYPKNRADQLSYQPTSKLVDTMFRTGQMVQAVKQNYDFEDGKDDGKPVPLDRTRGLEMPEISQMMLENEAKLEEHQKNLKKRTTAKEAEAGKEKTNEADKSQTANGGATAGSDNGGGSGAKSAE